jgi:hypothetical protein
MMRWTVVTVFAALSSIGITAAGAQNYPIMDRIAQRVIQKYQTSSCEQLAAQRAQRASGMRGDMEVRAVRLLHEDPQMRQAFLNKVAGPIANKLYECGMIP